MKNTLKMLIPIGLGLLAATVNWMSLTSSTKSVEFMKSTRDIKINEPISEKDFEKLSIPSDQAANLRESAILLKDIGLVSGQIATREIRDGDILFYRDTQIKGALLDLRTDSEAAMPVSLEGIRTPPGFMRVGDYVEFRIPGSETGRRSRSTPDTPEAEKYPPRWIGPYRLISVGSTITQNIDPTEGYQNVSQVTIAYDTKPNAAEKEKLDALVTFIDRSRTDDSVTLLTIRVYQKTSGE